MDFDFGIIGGGPAGYTAAINLSEKGFKVVLFEKDELGGTCLNRGCIPTKSLLHSSEVYRQIIQADTLGINLEIKDFNFKKIAEKRDNIVQKIRKSLELVVRNSGVQVVNHEAKIIDEITIVADKEYKVGKIISAIGSMPRIVDGLEFDGSFVLSSDDILKLDELPKSVLIVGTGAIGIEWARILSNFGVEVYLVEMAERMLPLADIEVSKRIERIFKQRKVKYYTCDFVKEIRNKTILLNSGVEIEVDCVLSAVGRMKKTMDYDDKIITIGDALGEIQLAHYAIYQGANITNTKISPDKLLVPSVVYGEPEIAWFGLREQDCDETYSKALLPITALGKSWCDDSTEGFIKIIAKDNKIVGAHIISKEASALLHQLLIASQFELTIDKLKEVCYAHPTYSEGIYETICRL